jgi:hypothetical protein
MKKQILILVLLIASLSSFSQDCSSIDRKVDKYNGEVSLHTPYKNVTFYKIISGQTTIYYMSLDAPGATCNLYEKGVKILLSNGTVMEWSDAEIETDVGAYGYIYSAFIQIDESEINQLLTSPITDFELYIYDGKVTKSQGEKLIVNLNCLINSY